MMTEEVLAAAALALVILVKRRKARRRKAKRYWMQPWLERRGEEGEGREIYNALMNEEKPEDPLEFSRFVRMDCACFDKLLSFIGVHIRKTDTVMRDSISPSHRLAVTLQYLATGETYQSLSVAHRISVPSISKIVVEVCSAICSTLKEKYLKAPTTEKEWEIIASEFNDLWQFPHCIGALDGKHIAFSPTQCSSDNKKFNSIVLLVVVDARYRFTLMDTICSNKDCDGDVFVNSRIGTALEENWLKIPQEKVLNCCNISAPYVIVAGDAFGLQPHIVKPYKHCEDEKSKIFNSRLSRAIHVVDNAFDILARRFRILSRTIRLPIEKTELLIQTLCLLHNFLIDEADSTYLSSMNSVDTRQDQIDGASSSEDSILQSIHQQENHMSLTATDVRDRFCDYFSTSGHIPQ